MDGSEQVGYITKFTCIMQKRLYKFYITVHEAYADATLNALLEMLHLHRIIIYSEYARLKEDILLTSIRAEVEVIVHCTILETNILIPPPSQTWSILFRFYTLWIFHRTFHIPMRAVTVRQKTLIRWRAISNIYMNIYLLRIYRYFDIYATSRHVLNMLIAIY